jgi:hypothetical protein
VTKDLLFALRSSILTLVLTMGVDFSAILDVSLDWPELPKVPAQLDLLTGRLSAIWTRSATQQRRWSLELQSWVYFVAGPCNDEEDEEVQCRLQPGLMGPLWFHIVPHQGFATLGHTARWKFFLGDLNERDRLRQSSRLIAETLGAKQIAYVPDLALEDIGEHGLYDKPFGRVIAYLQQVWGDASSFSQTYPVGVRYWERYFVEPL